MCFYQHFWQLLRQHLLDIFQTFYYGTLDLSLFNRVFVNLVPKKTGAQRVGDFQPINLINGIQKIISKVLACQLKERINALIEPSQSAFLRGCSILDGVITAQKIISTCSKW